jgi:hypothetical protein
MFRRSIAVLGYIIFLLAVVILGTELGLRAYFDDPEYWWDVRFLNISPGAYVIHDGFWLYKPNSVIRSAAIYGLPMPKYFPMSEFHVEYDCRFRTNRFGLQGNDGQYIASRPTVLVLGDSFTEGQGGCPWMDAVAQQYPDFNVLNGGVQSTGVESFYRLYQHLLTNGVEVSKIIVIAIANDFKRTPYVWPQAALDCLSLKEPCEKQLWNPLWLDQTHGQLIQEARERAKDQYARYSEQTKLHMWLMRKVYLYSFINRNLRTFFDNRSDEISQIKVAPTPNNVEALSLLSAADLGLEIIMVPQRDEVALRALNIDSLRVESLLKKMNIRFSWCTLVQGDYLPWDPHPNANGYAKLADCLRDKLDDVQTRTLK